MSGNFKKLKRKKLGSYPDFTVILSISLALFVIGLFSLLVIHASKLSDLIKDKFEVHAYLDKNLSPEQEDSIKTTISNFPFVQKKENKPVITFLSKEEAAQKFIKETGEDFFKVIGDNPLRSSFIIRLERQYADSISLKKVKAHLSGIRGIYEVDYKESLIIQINDNIQKIGFILIIFALILLITSILMINNTLKLALFSQRFLIRSMQLVGATKSFIQKPFLLRAVIQGIISGTLASATLFLVLQYLYNNVEELSLLADYEATLLIFLCLIALGAIIALFGSFRAVNKYLRLSLDELY